MNHSNLRVEFYNATVVDEFIEGLIEGLNSQQEVKQLCLFTLIYHIYITTVFAACVYGGIKGLGRWVVWICNRRRITVGHELVDPILNIGRDAGYGAYYFLVGIGISGLVAASFIVSIPLLSAMASTEPTPDPQPTRSSRDR